jgi:hypothetical protein
VNKSNKRLAGTFAVFALCCASAVSQAKEIQVIGPVEKVQSRSSSLTVLGQTFVSARAITGRDGRVGGIAVGDYVSITGEIVKGTLVARTIVTLAAPYVPGASEVLFRGPVAYAKATGLATAGGLQILLSQATSNSALNIESGDSIEVLGIQALPGGPVWASEIRIEPIGSAGTDSLSIQGTGLLSIQGTGTQSIQGTGTQSIQGTGTRSIQGTGTKSIQGTGVQSIQGTGALSIQGTGALSIQGTGKLSIQGTGKQSIQGTGVRSIQGTG